MDSVKFSNMFPGSVFLAGTPEYTATTTSYFAAFETELKPTCVVRPSSAQELGKVIKHVEDSNVKVAIKGGGHTAWAGSANIDGGVLIDLQNFKGVDLDRATGVVSIGAGERWGDVYQTLEKEGLTVAGGRVSKVGVSGLILGGGISYFSEQVGFVCDTVTSFEVVLGTGEVVKASNQHNEDLFVALKGGNNNFGIITKIEIPTFAQGPMWGGAVYYDASPWSSIVDLIYDFAASPDKSGAVIAARFHSPVMAGCVVNLYSNKVSDVSPTLKNMTSIQPPLLSTIREDSHYGFAQEQANFSQDGARQLFFTTSFKLSKDVMLKSAQLWEDAVKDLKDIAGFVLSLVFQPVTKQTLTESKQRGGNALGLSPEDGPFMVLLLNSVHSLATDDERVVIGVQALLRDINTLIEDEGKAIPYRFMNYAYRDTLVLEGYGKESVARLKAVSEKFDPKGFFQTVVPGGFKISAVV